VRVENGVFNLWKSADHRSSVISVISVAKPCHFSWFWCLSWLNPFQTVVAMHESFDNAHDQDHPASIASDVD